MKLSVALAFVSGLWVSLLVASSYAQVVVSQEHQLHGPLASWQTGPELEIANSLASTDPKSQTVVLEVRRISVDVNSDVPIKSYFKPGTFEVHSGSIPPVELNSNLGESRVSVADKPDSSTTRFASACDSVRKSMPVMLAKLDDQRVTALAKRLGSAFTSLPTITCFSGVPAVVNDLAQRPFVVGVKPLVDGKSVAHQPIIQIVEEGFVLRFKPTANSSKVDLEANLAHSSVSNVETFTLSGNEKEGVTIQIPEQTLKQVNLATQLEDGETLFIDPRLRVEAEQVQKSKRPFKKAKAVTVEQQIYFLVTARIIVESGEVATTLTRAK